MVAKTTELPQTATPLLTTSQQAFLAQALSAFGSYDQISFPVLASNAKTTLHGAVMNIMPSTTIGVVS